ncbi:uncharacterized protein LOC108675231 [Hyalella azteca]|uniref:Uncharacterized protein LOC108675231 n=1 Tax=Hyalella azteca TaxID=294128 RepID=A0A8B7NYD0_HYAAZ|nr:uncharacterized protein LOC108675231 [Hyalella azteca]
MKLNLFIAFTCSTLLCKASLFEASKVNLKDAGPEYLHERQQTAPQSRHSINAPHPSQRFQSNSPLEESVRPDIANHFSDMRRKRSTTQEKNTVATSGSSTNNGVDEQLNTILHASPNTAANNNKKKIDTMKLTAVKTAAPEERDVGRTKENHEIEAKISNITSVSERPRGDDPEIQYDKVGGKEGSINEFLMGPPAALQGPDNDAISNDNDFPDSPAKSDPNSDTEVDSDHKPATELHGSISPLQDQGYGVSEGTMSVTPGSQPTPRLSWLAEFLCSGRGPGWLALNIILLVFIILAAILSLFRLLGLRSCTALLSRTLYLFVMILCFTASAFTAVHLIHLCFGGKEGLPLVLTLILTHTPVPCLTVALCLVLQSILEAAREPWPISCAVLGRVSIVLVLASVASDIAVSLLHSTALLITCRVTLTAVALLPVFVFLLKYCRIREVHAALCREIQGELKLMVPPAKDSVAYEQRAAQYLLRDILSLWATLLLVACIVTVVLWGCNLSLSVFFSLPRVPVWLWWFCHSTNVLFQIILIILLIISCAITLDGRHISIWHKIFAVPKDIFSSPESESESAKRNFVYERVSYSSGIESSQRTSSSQNETDESDGRTPVSLNPQVAPSIRPRVTLQRSATFNCAPRMPLVYGYHPGYPHLLPQYYQRAGSYAQIHQHQAMPSSMLVNEAGFVRFNMPVQNFSYPVTMEQPEEMMKPNEGILLQAGDPNLFHPHMDIEYNSLRRFPRRYAGRQVTNIPEDPDSGHKFNPPEIRMIAHNSSNSEYAMSAGSVPVSPYHALPLLPAYPPAVMHAPIMSSFHPSVPSSTSASVDIKPYQSPPALPSRAGSFRNHYAAQTSPASSPLSSPYQLLPVGPNSYLLNQPSQRSSPSPHPPVLTPVSSSPYHGGLPVVKQRSSRPTSPAIHSLAFPPPPPVPSNSPSRSDHQQPQSPVDFDTSRPASRLSAAKLAGGPSSPPYSNHGSSPDTGHFKKPLNYDGSQKNLEYALNTPRNDANAQQLDETKSIESTVRDILTSCERPVFRPRKHPHRGRLPLRNQSFNRNDTQNIYENGPSANRNYQHEADHIDMDTISNAADGCVTDDDLPQDPVRNSAPSLKRNHSTAGCYYPKERKEPQCQTDDEGNKYSSYRLSQIGSKPVEWYGTWAGRRKSRNGAYSVDTEKNSVERSSADNRNSEKRLSSRASSILSLYNKLKSRKEKPPKDDSSEGTEKDETEVSQASTSDDTPTPSEKTADGISIATEGEKDLDNPLAEALDEIKDKSQDEADWTMDILSSSSVLSDFYKLKPDRPPPLPELAEVDG